jgi:signal transduction histidine kinase
MKERRRDIRERLGELSVFLIVYCVAVLLASGLTSVVYKATGKPPEAVVQLLSALIGVLFLALLMTVIRFSVLKQHTDRIMHSQQRLFHALDEISKGNFNVLLDPQSLGNFHGLAEAVNEMARNLGTLETMRQDFISNVSHEIQSPLTSIGGFAKLLKEEKLSTAERRHYAEIIESESRRLSSLSENLLKLSSLDKTPLNKSEFRLDKQLEQIALMLEPQWSAKNITFGADLHRATIAADMDLLSQVWVNLLHNAIKFTPEGGTVTVSLAGGAVSIADTGIGITDEDRVHIFERFYKVDKARDRSLGGNGLGLSLVKKIVELHGGAISAESKTGKGTVFEIILPDLHSV